MKQANLEMKKISKQKNLAKHLAKYSLIVDDETNRLTSANVHTYLSLCETSDEEVLY
jgi:hypothetical protein